MKIVGIIGGLGPETTAEFYLEIIFGSYARNKTARPPVLIWNVPLPYAIENDLLTSAKGEERYIPYLQDAARRLEKAGADFLVMPCNTLHKYIGEIRDCTSIPVLSIVEENALFLKGKGIRRVGIVATTSSIKGRLYEHGLKKAGIRQVAPTGLQQAKMGRIISNLVMNKHLNSDRQELIKIMADFKKVDAVLLACTDLQILVPDHSSLPIYDSMKVFAEATIKKIIS